MRLWTVCIPLGVLIPQVVRALVVALPEDDRQAAFTTPRFSSETATTWNLTAQPDYNSTGRWIFDTVNSFLQHWPNTRLRNGHNIVAGIVPTGTLLYHGTFTNALPDEAEWVATDPEHSYIFCAPLQDGSGCGHLTLVATRPLRVLYFDGSSAANIWDGPLDTQDALIWGGPQLNRTMDDWHRKDDLCFWGRKYDIDGFVRMEMDLEIILCDFTAGVEVVSFLEIVPNLNGDPSLFQHVTESGSWHNRFPGETRIQLDYSRVVSFYDTNLFPDVHARRAERERWDHNLDGLTSAEVKTLHQSLDVALKGDWGTVESGIDWKTLFGVIVDRYAERLELLQYILNGTSVTRNEGPEAILKNVQRHIQSMLATYTLHAVYPPSSDSPPDQQWAAPIFEQCATMHIRFMESNASLQDKFTYSEKLLLGAAKDVSKEICRVLVGMWAEGVDHGLKGDFPDAVTLSTPDELLGKWRKRAGRLIHWLDWSYWSKCRPACGDEEMCYLPTWPFFKKRPPSPRHGRVFARNSLLTPNSDIVDVDEAPGPDHDAEWYHPKPRCIRRIEPFEIMIPPPPTYT